MRNCCHYLVYIHIIKHLRVENGTTKINTENKTLFMNNEKLENNPFPSYIPN